MHNKKEIVSSFENKCRTIVRWSFKYDEYEKKN